MASNVGVSVGDALTALRARATVEGPRAAVMAVAAVGAEAVRVELARTSHPPGTPTLSPPGSPPSLVTGTLRSSLRVVGPVTVGPGVYLASIGGTAIYARIQELGGYAGRGGRSYLPPRPYLRPATEALAASGTLTETAAMAFVAAVFA